MRRFQKSDAERLVERLDREIRARGHGSIRAAERAVGFEAGWWQHRADTGEIKVHQMLAILDHLGLDPVGFVRSSLGADRGLELDRPRGKPPEIVAKARARFQSGEDGAGLGDCFIRKLDKQRHDNPAETWKIAQWGVDHVELARLPHLLGVAGSALWALLRLDEAEHAIQAALEIARREGDRVIVGGLLGRLSYVISARGDRVEALRIAERAAVSSLRAGNKDDVGRALVAQGICLYYLDRPAETIEALQVALDYLAPESARNRFAVFQVSGLAYQSLGDHPAALEEIDAAREALPAGNRWAKGKLQWLRARIYAEMRHLRAASTALEEVIAIFHELHHGETALAICELVRLQLAHGQSRAAYETATATRAFLHPLRHNRIISKAIGDLLRHGQAGLTLALVQRVVGQIESERQKGREWHSPLFRPSRDQPPGSKAGPIFAACSGIFE